MFDISIIIRGGFYLGEWYSLIFLLKISLLLLCGSGSKEKKSKNTLYMPIVIVQKGDAWNLDTKELKYEYVGVKSTRFDI